MTERSVAPQGMATSPVDLSNPSAALTAVLAFFEHIQAHDVSRLGTFYCDDAFFKDPFNEVRGLTAIQAIFAHMFEQLNEPRFVVRERMRQGQRAFLTWDFVFRFKRYDTTTEQVIHGATYLEIDEQGKVTLHRDYWDAAEELYEKLPVVGGVMRWLKARARS